jgi:hypothetical protein
MKSCKSDDISGALIGEPRRAVAQLCVYQLRSDVLSTSFWHRNKVNKASLLAPTYASGRRTEDQTRLGSTAINRTRFQSYMPCRTDRLSHSCLPHVAPSWLAAAPPIGIGALPGGTRHLAVSRATVQG